MKKYIFLATALAALVSCSENEFVGDENITNTSQNEQGAIAFGTGLKAVTRGDKEGADAAALLNNNFVVEGFKWNGNDTKEEVFDHYNVNWKANTANTTTSNTSNWEYVAQAKHAYGPAGNQTIKYWDYSKSQYDFIAYSVGTATADYSGGTYDNTKVQISQIDLSKMNGVSSGSPATITDGAYTIKGTAANLAKVYIADLVTAYRDPVATGDYQNEVTLRFRSLSAKVRIGLYETVPGYSVKDVVFYSNDDTKKSPTNPATWGDAYLYTTGGDVFNEEGTYIVYFPTTGSANKEKSDYNKAHLAFTAVTSGTKTDKTFGALKGSLSAEELALDEFEEAAGNLYLGRSSNAAIYAGNKSENYYTVVIPNETGAALNLKVDYKLVSTDGSGEVIAVTGATAKVPKEYATWKSGYAYTYLFKISQNTNGLTNPSVGPAGLYPITFDAVVMNSEVDGVQETITTVADPSITTYAKGQVVTTHNEYTTSDNIYVMVENGTSNLAVGNTANLYTVTLESGAAQTINEASVANAFKFGKPTYGAEVVANGTPLANVYYTRTGAEEPYTYEVCTSGTGDGSKTYYKKTADYAVKDANEKTMALTSATLKDVTEIAAGDSPTGNAIPINGVMFKPAAAGTYAFQYAKTITTAATYTAVTSGTTLIEGKTYYTSDAGAGLFIAKGNEVANGSNYFELTTPAVVSEWIYKIIKVQ
jgi:hypothetical protein